MLYLVQHAKAASKEEDPERPLTEQGRKEIEKVAALVRPLRLSVNCLWHSGKKRAIQTAETLAKVVKANTLTVRHGLGPIDDVTVLADELTAATKDVMIVGHLPFLAKLASLLLTGSEAAEPVAFKHGGIVCLGRTDENRWQIEWMVTPQFIADFI